MSAYHGLFHLQEVQMCHIHREELLPGIHEPLLMRRTRSALWEETQMAQHVSAHPQGQVVDQHRVNQNRVGQHHNYPEMNKWQETYKSSFYVELKGLIDVMLKKCNIKNKKGDDNASRSKKNAAASSNNNNVPPMNKSRKICN